MLELTPTLLFILLNVVILTIFLLSSFANPARRPQLTRASSFLSRVTSFGHSEPNNSGHTTPSLLSRAKEPGSPEMGQDPPEMGQPNKDLLEEEKCEGESRRWMMKWFKSDMEVDAKADDFIHKFKNQLKLQRLESLIRYRNSSN